MNISVRIIPHEKQRYETQGDWWFDADGILQIRVSALGNWVYETLIAIHEIVEAVLCKKRGIKETDVSAFDIHFEHERLNGLHGDKEPGDDANAPYRREHFAAELVERLVADQFNVRWDEYQESGP